MMNELHLQDSAWTECISWENGKFKQLLYQVATDLTPDDRIVKWKTCDNHLTIRSPNHYYKIYQKDYDSGYFFALIRTKLAEIYREYYNIQWDVTTIFEDNMIYQIERRQPIRQLTSADMTFGELLNNWSKTLKLLEKRLGLHKLAYHIQEHIPNLKSIKLVRDCINDYGDYGITESGDVILFDDCDWFLAFIDDEGQWIEWPYNCYLCEILDEQFSLVPNRWKMFKTHQMFLKANERSGKWTLMKNIDMDDDKVTRMFNARDRMINNNIMLFLNPNNQLLIDNVTVVEDEFNIDDQYTLGGSSVK